jgi:hypothetical protein
MKIIFPIYHFFPESEKNFLENNKSSFQKCPLGKKGNPYDIFHARKGHFAPGKRALGKTWRGLPPPPPWVHILKTFITYLLVHMHWKKKIAANIASVNRP